MAKAKRPSADATESTRGDGDETALMLSAARRYYWDDQSKVSIGQELGISRFQVARLLQDARRSGLVRIEIGSPGHVDQELSAKLTDQLGIPRVIVVEAHPTSAQATFDLVGATLASEVEDTVVEGATIGIAWSRAAPAMARKLRRLARCEVVQLSGAVYPPAGMPGSVEVTRDVAAAAAGTAHILYAPLVVPDVETAAGLRRQPEIAETLARADDLDVAVLSVGAWLPGSSAVYELLNEHEREELTNTAIHGEVSGRLLDAEGRPVPNPLDERVVGATLDQLGAARLIITTASGAQRRDATIAVTRAGLAHTLIIDTELAEALLA
ncbi:sugar-binding transcriptional regulator [Microlunatus soli]|uniref:DNA-binding transcriptional regulator LsrR, DeoR family n=1 Tax=Microlunatus soli TaxID=630515 RepID=A0A1H1TR48_9ACTN|nr:sugar-binding domain-containing protein [Microlunatus soli]SDS62708.1 DNA-binding transcriptional regulator LsrR, DeoR family [Microlunatus soli]